MVGVGVELVRVRVQVVISVGLLLFCEYLGHSTFTLEYLNEHGRLVILIRRKCLRFFGRDDGVTVDDFGHDTTYGLDTLGKRGYI